MPCDSQFRTEFLNFYKRASESLTKDLSQTNFCKCHIRRLNKLLETEQGRKLTLSQKQ